MEWPEEATDALLQDLKLQTAQLFEAYDQATDQIAFLHEKIQSQLMKAQPLPYMQRAYWTDENLTELKNRNEQAGAEIYPLSQLPQTGPANAKKYFFDWCQYTYEEGVTNVLEPKDVTKLMALTCCRLIVSSRTSTTLLSKDAEAKRPRTA